MRVSVHARAAAVTECTIGPHVRGLWPLFAIVLAVLLVELVPQSSNRHSIPRLVFHNSVLCLTAGESKISVNFEIATCGSCNPGTQGLRPSSPH